MPEETSQQLRSEQQRAAHAWKKIDDIQNDTGIDQKQYGSLVRGLPAMLQSNGLGQTLAFLKAKAKGDLRSVHMILYNHLAEWVGKCVNSQGDLLGWVITQRSDTYRRATTEAITYALWLRRFAEAQGWGDTQGDSR